MLEKPKARPGVSPYYQGSTGTPWNPMLLVALTAVAAPLALISLAWNWRRLGRKSFTGPWLGAYIVVVVLIVVGIALFINLSITYEVNPGLVAALLPLALAPVGAQFGMLITQGYAQWTGYNAHNAQGVPLEQVEFRWRGPIIAGVATGLGLLAFILVIFFTAS